MNRIARCKATRHCSPLIPVYLLMLTLTLIHIPKRGLAGIDPICIALTKLSDIRFKQASTANDTSITIPDIAYEYYLEELSNRSPIDFDYNRHVKRYIDIYVKERSEQVSKMLGLAKFYFPLFDSYFDRFHLPLELKYLAVVESALNPMAVSSSGAVGLWQFKINTAKMFDLKVDSYVDERCDPEKSTEAACRYLQYLYRTFKNWHLAIAAYNTGPQPIRKVILQNGGETDFWTLYDKLPESAQNYLSAFMAAAYIMQYPDNHGIRPSVPIIGYNQTDTIHISEGVNLLVVSKILSIPMETLRFLNPTYRLDYIPKSKQPLPLRLPIDKMDSFITSRVKIIKKSKKGTSPKHDSLTNPTNLNKIDYRIKKGDSMHKIAIKFRCTIEDILRWNPESDTLLHAGQTLIIWSAP